MNITRCFTSDACRKCPISYYELQTFYELDKVEANMLKIEMEREILSIHVFEIAIGSSRKFFFPPDTFHDWTSNGIIYKVVGSLMIMFYQEVDQRNSRRNLRKFNQIKTSIFEKLKMNHHRNGFIDDIDDNCVIKGTGTQQIDFFLLFGFLDDEIDRDCEEWKVYELAREIYIFFSSESYSFEELDEIKVKIEIFSELFYVKFVKTKITTFTMKVHFLIHYVDWAIKLGPLERYRTTKYERFHQPHKKSQLLNAQFKNKPFSIGKWYALGLRVNFNLLEFELKKKLNRSDFDCQSLSQYSRFFNFSKVIYQVKDLTIKKVLFKKGFYFRMKNSSGNLPQFVRIVFTAKEDEDFIIIASFLKTISFEKESFCFKVSFTSELRRISYDDVHYHQCTFLSDDRHYYILQDFKF
jgi:hypothetical protein